MEYRQFGRTDIKVSSIGFGCWEISGTYGPIDDGAVRTGGASRTRRGINCFDTAEAYGMGISEEALARALGFAATMLSSSPRSASATEAPNRRDSSRARIMASLEQSLQSRH